MINYLLNLIFTHLLRLVDDLVLLDEHLVEHEPVLHQQDEDRREGEEDGLREEDPLSLGRRGVEPAEPVGDGGHGVGHGRVCVHADAAVAIAAASALSSWKDKKKIKVELALPA